MVKAAGIGSVSRERLSKVIQKALGGVTTAVVVETLGVSNQEAGRLLSRWSRAGWLKRIKRGFYIPLAVENTSDNLAVENPWPIVSRIYSPGYIGGFSAIKHWDLSEQIYEVVVFFSTRKVHVRTPILSGIKVQIKTIRAEKVFGTKSVWIGSTKVLVSDPSKTIVDLLDEPVLVGGMRIVRDVIESYLNSDHKNLEDLYKYTLRMRNRTIFKRLGFLFEQLVPNEVEFIAKLKNQISEGYSNFDPGIDNNKIIRRWNLKVPHSWVKK